MHFSHLLTGAAIAAVTLALPQKEWAYGTFEELARPPRGWTQMEQEVRASHMLELEFHLAPPNGDAFEQHVIDISTPGHAAYGNHMDRDQINMMLQPSDDAVTSIFSWLSATGYGDKMQAQDDWVKLHISVAEAEKLLQTKYYYYKSDDDGTVLLRTLSVQLPKEVLPHVDFVQPTTAMLKMTPQRSWLSDKFEMYGPAPAEGICNGSAITPSCVKKVYQLDSYKPEGLASVGVSGYLEEYAQKADLEQFLETFVPEFAGTSFPVVSINGGLNLQATDGNKNLSVGEANLDIQWTTGLNTPIVNTYYTTAGRAPIDPTVDNPAPSTNEPYTTQLKYLLSLDKLPDVLSTSYGEPEISVPLSFRLQVCKLFAQLGARGVSVIFSSGDLGPGAACLSNDGKNTTTFEPIFPAACPFVTSVGGTKGVPEVAVELSSGGFSVTWDRPAYQEAAVSSYLAENRDLWEPFAPFINLKGRAFPDVAGFAQNLTFVELGKVGRVGGTSAAAPVFAAAVSMANDKRLKDGKKAFGFLNPLIYRFPNAFRDITEGSSVGCNGVNPQTRQPIPGGAVVPNAGWKAVKGWDPSTGLGSTQLDKLLELP